jgi:hypothetical protein
MHFKVFPPCQIEFEYAKDRQRSSSSVRPPLGTQQAIDGDWPMGWGLSFEKPEQMSLYNTTDEIREIGFVNDNRVFYHSTVSSGTLFVFFFFCCCYHYFRCFQ